MNLYRGTTLFEVLSFPRVINEKAARTVAGVVALTGDDRSRPAALAADPARLRLLGARADRPEAEPAGPTRHEGSRRGSASRADVAGPPKRFAQGMGAAIDHARRGALALGWTTVTTVLLADARRRRDARVRLGLCIGCQVFAGLMRAGIVPETVCVECADISRRLVNTCGMEARRRRPLDGLRHPRRGRVRGPAAALAGIRVLDAAGPRPTRASRWRPRWPCCRR